jgi:AraC-like DNA-binding protein
VHAWGRVAAAHCRLFLRALRARGVDPRQQPALSAIACFDRDDVPRFLSAAQFHAFLRLVEELSADANVGLLAGETVRVEDAGLLGLLLRSSADGRSAYERWRRYAAINHASDLELSLVEGTLVCRRVMPGVPSSRTLSDYFLARTVSMVRQLLGPVEPLEVRTLHERPANPQEYQRLFGAQLCFGAREDALVFGADLLARPMLHRDRVTAAVLERYVACLPELNGPTPLDVIARARQAISDELREGRVSTRGVSGRLKLHERTLRRHLHDAGTNFQQLLDEVRRDHALGYLRASQYSGAELGARLGFHSTSAFYRAFRRWTGSSISAYRLRYS